MNKIIYLDAAASSLKSDAVIAAEMDFLRHKYANAGRGICGRAAAVDDMVMQTRRDVAQFINATQSQIVFTSGATDGLNRVVRLICGEIGNKNVLVAVSDLDHHSARLPWMAIGADLKIMPLDDGYNYDLAAVPKSDVMVITAMSNVFGMPQDVGAIIRVARQKNPDVIVVVDAAQYAAHAVIDATAWGADFICFSGHKIGADTGIGVMYIKEPDRWRPDKFGGGMINKIVGNDLFFNPAPERFEAGTLPLTQIAGLGPAVAQWRPGVATDVMRCLYDGLSVNSRINIYTVRDASVLTFDVDGMHPLDFGAIIGTRGLCMRVGNMCASWAMRMLNAPGGGLARMSAGWWNSIADADAAVEIINNIVK